MCNCRTLPAIFLFGHHWKPQCRHDEGKVSVSKSRITSYDQAASCICSGMVEGLRMQKRVRS